MTGVTEGIGGMILPEGMTIRVVGPVPAEEVKRARAARQRERQADAVRRIAELEASRFPRLMVWDPGTSASGKWEAMADDGWVIDGEESPVTFLGLLEKALAGEVPAEGAAPQDGTDDAGCAPSRSSAGTRTRRNGRTAARAAAPTAATTTTTGGSSSPTGSGAGGAARAGDARRLAGVVRQRMNCGRILPGDHLKAAELADRHHVALEVADAALGILGGEGRVRRDGSGYVVTGRPEGDPDTAPFPADEFTYRVVADRLAARIKAGEFTGSGKLPGAAGLATHYGVGAAVLRHARQELTERGLIRHVPGAGTFVT